ncbi:AAA family ATPase [Acinetobacter higginsii]|uniref:AAA family ATPase n=1 Tax=Acinetobacter higginsii TaxID=70347 RepID=UPI001F4AFFEF|nr:AAA family ATPase [Acinetobacter higginsii]MCH7296165.1 AAA family ATPase [Acinetobacter higginsii]
MRLLSLELIGQYKGLRDQYFDFRNTEGNFLALIGRNGSGKSQLLELIAETFAYLERKQRKDFKTRNWFDFEIKLSYFASEVDLELHEQEYSVWIDKLGRAHCTKNGEEFFDLDNLPLPSHVIGYSSGLNENLQRAFMKNNIQYLDVMNARRRFEERLISIQHDREIHARYDTEVRQEFFDQLIEDTYSYYKTRYPGVFPDIGNIRVLDSYNLGLRTTSVPVMKYLDHDCTCLLLASLGVLNSKEQERIFIKEQRFKCVHVVKFRYDLRKFQYDSGALLDIKRLIQCIGGTENKKFKPISERTSDDFYNQFELDYLCGEITLDFSEPQLKEDLKEAFLEPKVLFEKLYRIQLLGAEFWPSGIKKDLRKDDFDFNVKKPQKWAAPLQVLSLKLCDETDEIINFEDLSDGEAQLIQILAMSALFKDSRVLFLLDEPETHLNPAWRTYFHRYLDEAMKISHNNYNPWVQYFISTHSPFMISSLKKNNVFFFKRKGNGLIDLKSVDEETYGASFDVIIKRYFGLRSLISHSVIDEIREQFEHGEAYAKQWIESNLGLSAERAYLIKKLSD